MPKEKRGSERSSVCWCVTSIFWKIYKDKFWIFGWATCSQIASFYIVDLKYKKNQQITGLMRASADNQAQAL